MFQSTHHLPQRLNRDHYTSPEIAQRELERMFLPGWHLLGAWSDAPRIGDFFTRDLFDRPLVCWRTSQGFQTFLNVCTHRLCTITNRPRGHFAEHIKCQYHGWEFDESGNTCKIPDAQHFRPLTKGELGLKEFRTETMGQLIFVTFNEQAPPLADYLGPQITEWCQRNFTPQHRLTYQLDWHYDSNWKIVAENVVEGYHLPSVHPTSFGNYPNAENCFHDFHPTYNYYKVTSSADAPGATAERIMARASGREPKYDWEHMVRYPHLTFGGTGAFHFAQSFMPVTIATCRTFLYVMHDSGPKGRLWPFLVHRLLKRLGRRLGLKINYEDAALYPSIQRGITAQDQPHGAGLISAREERIFHFQNYVVETLGEGQFCNPPPDVDPLTQPLREIATTR